MKVIKSNKESLESIRAGVNFAANLVLPTLGPCGTNVIIGRKFERPKSTNDGKTILGATELVDEVENEAVKILYEGAEKLERKVKDGTSTFTEITRGIVNTGFVRMHQADSFIKTAHSSQSLRKELNTARDLVIAELKKHATPVKGIEDLQNIAFSSVEDKTIGDMIAHVVDTVGKDGHIKVEEDEMLDVSYSISEGMEVSAGYLSRDMVTNDETLEAVFDDAHILVIKGKVDVQESITPIIAKLNESKANELVIFAEDFNQDLIRVCISNWKKNIFKVLTIKVNVWDKGILDDICTVSGATLIEPEKAMVADTLEVLGKVKKVKVTSKDTLIIGGVEDKKKAITKLKAEMKGAKAFDKQKLEERVARISGKVAVISVGAINDTERGYLKDKIDDAVGATQGALIDGVVRGGGFTLNKIANDLPHNILTEILKVPYNKIKNDIGMEIPETVIDPVRVPIEVIQMACSTAWSLFGSSAVIADKNETDTE